MMFPLYRNIYLLFSLLGMLLSPVSALAVPASSQIPLDSWVYSALDKLSGLGLVDSALQGARPYSRYEAARQVDAASNSSQYQEVSPAIAGLIRRLEKELSDSLADLRSGTAGSYIKPREVELKYVYQNGDDAVIAGGGVIASQFPLNYNNYGLTHQDNNALLVLQGEARLGSYLLLEGRPLLQFQDGDQSETDVSLLDGRVALQLGAFEISVGRQSVWWGQGRHGSLVLTNNAKPFDMVRLTNPTPTLLPWIFKYLGPIRLDMFWSRLEEDRVVSDPYFAGMRVNFKPFPWVELGASRAVIFGGTRDYGNGEKIDVGTSDYITILGGKNLTGGEDTSNSVAAVDARIRLPFLWNTEVYGEYGGEDEAGHFLAAHAWLAGIYLPQIDPSGRFSLTFEYADLSRKDNMAPNWYNHGIFKSGYTYEGTIMGHHVGGSARDTYLELQTILTEQLLLTLGLDYEERGFDQPVREKYAQGLLKIDWAFAQNYSLNCSFGYAKAKNFRFIANNNEDISLISVGLRGHW